MARGRMISKTISLDEKVDALPDDTARLLFTWLIPHLDCDGRMYGDASLFKSLVAPRRDISLQKIELYLNEMEKLGLILRYTVNGHKYIWCKNFSKHQTGLRKERESPSQIPSPTPEYIQQNVGVTPSLSTDKLPPKLSKVKLSLREVKEDSSFLEYVRELEPKYPTLKINDEIDKFITWWSEGNKELKRPKTAFRNWLDKAIVIQASNQSKMQSSQLASSKFGDGWH